MVEELWNTVRNGVELGGPVVVVLVALSIVSLAVALYKMWQFQAAGVGRHRALQEAIHAWDRNDQEGTERHLNRSSSYLAPVARLGVSLSGTTNMAVRLEAEAEDAFERLRRGLRALDVITQVAPLIGLFGTVLGMIEAFQALQDAGDQVDPSILAGGIWVALLTTAVGLAVAMPTAVLLSWFEGRLERERVLAERIISVLFCPERRAEPTLKTQTLGA
ncbi:MAG: MotA/TolQ/ExbB proton channel family protein [Pseudomonadota bacterium]